MPNLLKVGDHVWLNEYGGLFWSTVRRVISNDVFESQHRTYDRARVVPAVLAFKNEAGELSGLPLVPEKAEELARRGLLIKIPQPLNSYAIHPSHSTCVHILQALR